MRQRFTILSGVAALALAFVGCGETTLDFFPPGSEPPSGIAGAASPEAPAPSVPSGSLGGAASAAGGASSTTPGLRIGSPVGSPIQPGSECSVSSTREVYLVVANTFGRVLNVFWVDYGCDERDYGPVAMDGRFERTTYATHAWRFRDATTDELLLEYIASETPVQNVSLP